MTEIKLFDGYDEWFGPYWIGCYPLDADTIIRQIDNAAGDDLTVRINSGGGNVFDGWAIYNALLRHDGNVTVIIEGVAASIASIIAMAGHRVVMMPGSILMVHKPMTTSWEPLNADDLRKEISTLDKIQDILADIYNDRTQLGTELINDLINAETWLKPSEAVQFGFADEVGKGVARAVLTNSLKPFMDLMPSGMESYTNRLLTNNSKMATNRKKTSRQLIKENNGKLNLAQRSIRAIKNFMGFENAEAELVGGSTIYFEGELEIGTVVYEDEDMTVTVSDDDHELADGRMITTVDGEIKAIEELDEGEEEEDEGGDVENRGKFRQLQNRNKTLVAENNRLREQLEKNNGLFDKLKEVQSKGKPAGRQTNFRRKEGADNYREEMSNRRKSYKK